MARGGVHGNAWLFVDDKQAFILVQHIDAYVRCLQMCFFGWRNGDLNDIAKLQFVVGFPSAAIDLYQLIFLQILLYVRT